LLALIKKNYSNEEVKNFLKDILPDHRIDLFHLLMNRIEALEIQNFNLIGLNEQYVNQIKEHIETLVDNLDTLLDIKNVINQVYDAQAITKNFIAVKDTLNERDDFIAQQRDLYIAEKDKLETTTLYNQNLDVLLCKDKRIELKGKKAVEVNQENDNKDILLHDNYILKTNNIRLRNLLIELLKENNNITAPGNLMEQLNYILNTNYDVMLSGDLMYLLNSQAKLIEDNLFK
jgi:hypothetical protein